MKPFLLGILTLLGAIGANAATLSGTVTSDTGSPLAGMTAAAYTTAGALAASGATTASGTYSLTVPAGTYRVLAYDPSGTFATSFYGDAESFETSASVAVSSAQNVTNLNFRLVRSGFVVGYVTATGGTPLPNVTVAAYNLSGTRRGFTKSGATGSFTLALPPGTFKVVAYDDALSYAPAFFENAASFAAATPLTVASTASTAANIELPPAAKIAGTVTDRATLATLPAMRVTAYAGDGSIAAQTLTGSDGHFAMAARAGALRVVVDDPQGDYATTYVPDAESFSTQPAVSAVAAETLPVNATMVRGGLLAGRVTDRVSGAPLANLTAVAYNVDGTTRAFAATDAAGAYSIVVPPGDFRVGVFDSALIYLPQFYPSQTTFAAATPQHAIAQQSVGGLDFALTRGARVTAHVSARASGAALPGITVGAYELSGRLLASAITDASGTATLLLPAGTVKLLASDSSLQFANAYYLDAATFAATQPVALTEGQSLATTFSMTEGGRITGTVTSALTGAPLAAMQVIVYDGTLQEIVQTTSDANGAFRIAVPAGTYIVAAADPAHHYATVFYAGATTAAGASSVGVTTGRDTFPLALRLTAAEPLARRRTVRH
jgi:hypothetical protein